MKTLALFTSALLAGLAPVFAQSTSTSTSYSLLHAPAGDLGGGGRVTNAGTTVTVDISVGDPASGVVSNVSAGGVVAKGNLVGQFTDVKGLTLTSASPEVNEGATLQFDALQVLDDATLTAVPATSVAWTVSGPLTGISAGGLATAAAVYQNSVATVQGVLGSVFGTRPVTVLNVNADNFGAYGSDGLDDDWQALYFGQPPNANAAPTADPDGDGRNNRFEFLSGFVPTDPASAFQFTITGFTSPSVAELRLNKVIPGRTYTVMANTDLVTPPMTVGAPFTVGSEEANRLFQDGAATGARKFYYLEISKP